jgi:HSP20 family protein
MKSFSELWGELDDIARLHMKRTSESAALRPEGWVPPVDIFDTEAEIVLLVDIPGVAKEDVEIELSGGVLSIRGQKKFAGHSAGERYYRVECSYGPFERSFAIRPPVDHQNVKASFSNGVLRVILPKVGQKSRSIPVKSG